MGEHLDAYTINYEADMQALGNHHMESLSPDKKRVKCPSKNYVFKIPAGLQDRL